MNRQIIPLPLPTYLATYFGNKLAAPQKKLKPGSFKDPFLVSGHSEFGEFLLKLLVPAKTPYQLKDKDAFFISVSNYAGNNNPEVIQGKRHFITLDQEGQKLLYEKFRQVFRLHLGIYVRGAESEHLGKEKPARVRTRAIRNFCEEHHVIYTDKNLVAWKKMCQRNKYSPKPLIYGLV